jgi:multidrug efflux system membrane fusion protein
MTTRLPFILVSAALVLTACKGAAPPPAERIARVSAQAATLGPGAPPIVTTGVIVSRDEVKLSFKVAGIVRDVAVEEGDTIRRGQRLAGLELREVDANLAQARETAEKAERDLQRGEGLRRDRLISEQQLDTLRTAAQVANAARRAAQFNQEFATSEAPRDGVVLRKLVQPRELVGAGQSAFVIAPKDRGYIVRAGLSDREVVQLHPGDPARVTMDAHPGQVLDGTVTMIPAAANATTGLFDVEVGLKDPAVPLVSGLVARLEVSPAAARSATRTHVPIAALVEADGSRGAVFVLDDGHARHRPVTIAFIGPETIGLEGGVKPGETVITGGALYLGDGDAVALEQARP